MELSTEIQESLRSICRRHFVASLDMFGSAAKGSDTLMSDIDLIVEFKEEASVDHYAKNFFALLKELSQLFGKKVDLLTYRALRNPVMIDEIEQHKQSLYVD